MINTINTDRHILICGEFSSSTASDIICELEDLRSTTDPIYITICSPGGDASSALWVAEYLRSIPNWIIGIAGGECASAGLLIYCACDERWAFPAASFYQHHMILDGLVVANKSNMNQAHASYTTILDSLIEIQRPAFSKLSKKEYEKWSGIDKFFTAQEAIKIGLVHKLIEKVKKVKP